jgi:carbonic anhydrase/acetyltransferase-like protein (isoleucine patch superfamily)
VIGYEEVIGYGANIGNEAKISDGAVIGNKAKIGNGAKIVKTIFITGSKHTVNWYDTGIIHIGCYKKEIEWWLKNYKLIGEKENYSSDEIEEYHKYILICQQLKQSCQPPA